MGFARLCLVLIALAGLAASSSPAAATTSRIVGVTETEYRITLGRTTVPHGRVTFSIANFGQDDHNLKVARHQIGHGFSGRIPAGGHTQFTVRLTPGTYNLYCAIPGHRAMGMIRRLVVT
jgi:plastocyanin